MNSKFLNLNWKDALNGLIMAVSSSVLTALLTALQNGGAIDWSLVGKVALIATLTYILNQLGTDQNGNPLGINLKK